MGDGAGHLPSAKVLVGGGGKGTCTADDLSGTAELAVVVCCEVMLVPGDGIAPSECHSVVV